MRPHIRRFAEVCIDHLDFAEPIVEVGSFQVEGQADIIDFRALLGGRDYVGTDLREGPGVDRVENLHGLTFADAEVGTYLVFDTMEHVRHPELAFDELRRTLRPDGIALVSSVMLFPIHGYPSDYWRYTPEAFRELSAGFPLAAVFYAGDPNLPHSVCAVLAGSPERRAEVEALVAALAEVTVPAVHKTDRETARIIRRLTMKLIDAPEPMTPGTDPAGAFDRPFAVPGWTAMSGMWIQGWVDAPSGTRIEVRSGARLLHATTLTIDRAEGSGFQDQLLLERAGDEITQLDLVVVDAAGEELLVCRSATGILLSSVQPDTGFTLHSLDVRDATDTDVTPTTAAGELDRGRHLVSAIRSRGEPVRVDLGCGFRKEGNIGIDVTRDGTDADLLCVMGFEPIPLDDGVADEVFCRDFLEHIPKGIYSEREGQMQYPVIDLFAEIWRVMAPGGVFTSLTPGYPEPEVHQDPTHVSVWTENSFGYFTGDYKLAENYGFPGAFEKIEVSRQGFYIKAVLRKPDPDTEAR